MLPLRHICHRELRKQLLEQCQDEIEALHPLQLVIFSPLKTRSSTKKTKKEEQRSATSIRMSHSYTQVLAICIYCDELVGVTNAKQQFTRCKNHHSFLGGHANVFIKPFVATQKEVKINRVI